MKEKENFQIISTNILSSVCLGFHLLGIWHIDACFEVILIMCVLNKGKM